MIRNLIFSSLMGLSLLLPVPTLAQKLPRAAEVESLVKVQSPDSAKTSLRQDAGGRTSAAPAPTKATAKEDNARGNELRMLVAALLLMLAIGIRRYRSDAR